MDSTSALQFATGPSQAAPLSPAQLLASAPLSWSEIEQTSAGRFTLSVTHRDVGGCLLTSDVNFVEVDENEWAIDAVTGPDLDDEAAAFLCGDLKSWSRCEGSIYRDIAAYLEPA